MRVVNILLLGFAAPLLLGLLYLKPGRRVTSYGYYWVLGWVTMFGVFYPLAMFFTFTGRPFDQLCRLYTVLLMVLCLAAAVVFLVNCRRLNLDFLKGLRLLRDNPALWLLIAAVILCLARTVLFARINYSDDDTYTTLTNDILASNRIYGLSELTGEIVPLSEIHIKYKYMMLMPFCAFFSRAFSIHPTTLMFTVMPFVMLPAYYFIMWQFSGLFFGARNEGLSSPVRPDGLRRVGLGSEKDARIFSAGSEKEAVRKRALTLLLLLVFNEIGWANWTTTMSMYLFGGLWYGKAVVEFVALPLFLYSFMDTMDEERLSWRDIVLWIVLTSASYAASLMGVLLLPSEMIVLAVMYAVRKKRLARPIFMAALCMPAAYMTVNILRWYLEHR